MLLGSVIMATSFILPLQVGHASTSIANVRRSGGREPVQLSQGGRA
jgi:hypothetical protein